MVVVNSAGFVVGGFHSPVEIDRAPGEPVVRGAKKKDHWPAISALLERPGGADTKTVAEVLGWKTAPSLWFFRKWAEEAGRAADLVDHGLIEGQRTFSLRPPERR